MRILVTGVSGYVGSRLVPRLVREGHELRGFARDPARVELDVPLVVGDAITGAGLDAALDGIEVAYFLIHSMEPVAGRDRADGFALRERTAAERFAVAARAAGVRRVVYLGGLEPPADPSPHLASRLGVERVVLAAAPEAIALRASIVIGAGSRSFRFLVRLIERLPVLALPAWRENRTQPIDERDVIELLVRAATHPLPRGRRARVALDAFGPDVVSYRELIERIRDHLLLDRPTLGFDLLGPPGLASRVAAAVAGERHELVGPLMAGLGSDLLPREPDAAALLGVTVHTLDAAIEHALRAWEREEPLAAW